MSKYFISNNGADEVIAGNVAQALRDAGFTVRFAGTDLKIGGKIGTWMRKTTNECDRMIAVCSEHYFSEKAKYSGWERDSYMWFDVGGDESSVIPVIVADCTLDKLMADRLSHDLRSESLDALIQKLRDLEAVDETPGAAAAQAAARRATGPFIGVPVGRVVIGRANDIAALRAKLLTSREVQVTNSGAILAGQGGIGKSTLARAYAEAHRGDYHGVLWVAAATRQQVIDGLMNLCGPLGLALPAAAKEADAHGVLAKLEASGRDWLVIYDNVESYAGFQGLEPRGAHLIATTRQGAGWPGFAVLPTDKLDYATEAGAAVGLLMAEARRDDEAAGARALAEALGGLPLALVMAGALIRDEGQSFADYLTEVARIIATEPKNEAYPDSVIGAVKLSYDKLGPDAKVVADLFSWWAPEGLTAELISGAPEGQWWARYEAELPEAVRALADDAGRVKAAMAELADRSLTQRGADGAAMHRMTAAALRALQAGRGAGAVAEAAAVLLKAVYPGGDKSPAHSPQWPLCRRLTPHVRALWASGAAPKIAAMDTLLNQAAIYLDKIADYPGGVEMARAALALKEARLPEADREVAVGLATLGMALQNIGDLDGALAHLDRAVALDAAHRPGSADLADSYDLQGGVLLQIGRGGDAAALGRAAKRYQQALALRRGLFGRRSEPVAQALNNLGAVRDAQGRTAAAARLYGASLAIWRAVLPPGDARLGYGLMNTGAMWLKAGQADRAEALLAEALDLWRAVYAGQPQHPETRLAADWLISCLLVRARAGEDRDEREAAARLLCGEFGFDFDEMRATVAQIPYDGAGPEG